MNPLELQIEEKADNASFNGKLNILSAEGYALSSGWRDCKSPKMLACAENIVSFIEAIDKNVLPETSLYRGIYIQKPLSQLQ